MLRDGAQPSTQTSCSSVGRLGTDVRSARILEGETSAEGRNVPLPRAPPAPPPSSKPQPKASRPDFSGFFPWSLTSHCHLSLLLFFPVLGLDTSCCLHPTPALVVAPLIPKSNPSVTPHSSCWGWGAGERETETDRQRDTCQFSQRLLGINRKF